MRSLALLSFILFGLFLRLQNISPFKFYPDAYQNLLVALNIQNYGSVAGFLGDGGMFYPPFFMWTRPVYPLLINSVSFLTSQSIEQTALNICLITSLLSIPLAYFFVSRLFNCRLTGLLAAFLLASSFNHVVWSGFVYTEAPSIFFNLLFLLSLTFNFNQKSLLANKFDLLSGILFSFAIFSRYEYAILLIPVTYLIFKTSPTPLVKLANLAIATTCTSALILTQLFPISDLIPVITTQLHKLIYLTLILAAISGAVVLIKLYLPKSQMKKISELLPNVLIVLLLFMTTLISIQIIFGNSVPLSTELSAVKKFFFHDFLIAIFFVIGTILLLREQKYRYLAYFSLIGIVLLAPIYYNINPDMQRYWTHLLPFILPIASYPILAIPLTTDNWKLKTLTYSLLVLLAFAQILHTAQGIKSWNNGDWTKVSYEEQSAKILNENLTTAQLKTDNLLLITSMPESYFLYTGVPTNSVADHPPFIFIDEKLDQKTVLLIQDEGMKDLFPTFNQFIEKNLQDKKISEYKVDSNYHFAVKTIKETTPIQVYKLPLWELKDRINSH